MKHLALSISEYDVSLTEAMPTQKNRPTHLSFSAKGIPNAQNKIICRRDKFSEENGHEVIDEELNEKTKISINVFRSPPDTAIGEYPEKLDFITGRHSNISNHGPLYTVSIYMTDEIFDRLEKRVITYGEPRSLDLSIEFPSQPNSPAISARNPTLLNGKIWDATENPNALVSDWEFRWSLSPLSLATYLPDRRRISREQITKVLYALDDFKKTVFYGFAVVFFAIVISGIFAAT